MKGICLDYLDWIGQVKEISFWIHSVLNWADMTECCGNMYDS